MRKREFLTVAGAGIVTPVLAASGPDRPTPTRAASPTLLTLIGDVSKTNRGPMNPALDQLMVKQSETFEKALEFSYSDLTALPAQTINPTLEYDGRSHRLTGPLLVDVLEVAGATTTKGQLAMRALDGYAVPISIADAMRYRMLLATHIDGKPLGLGGLGPLWVLYDADRIPQIAAKPLNQRFSACPWGVYLIRVTA